MAQAETTDRTYIHGYKASHIQHHASRTAESHAAYLLPHLMNMAESHPQIDLLDVGAGPGTISASLAKYIPEGTVTATDISDEVLERALSHARECGQNNVKTKFADVYSLPFDDSSFDIVHASQVLIHLNEPHRAVKEMLRVCKTGGIIAIRDADLKAWSVHPELPGLRSFQQAIGQVTSCMNAGSKLVAWAMEAGVKREDITYSVGSFCYSTPEERKMWGGAMRERLRDGGMREKLLQDGKWKKEQIEDMERAWDQWIVTEDATFGSLNGEIVIKVK
ncbi:hypothetical protein PROFUN_11982 [Planoprotostelium fungivorum]|uniref:Methyltransferase type 11 domain-containing protein n=1 Tax=Planoprotostelium fungivorum TaxID=1890364 RepID=A0A2P6N8V7_9EUKA|nr:hypothetical protein PROFUN_11982 [Planoprotostelium fungivorum]